MLGLIIVSQVALANEPLTLRIYVAGESVEEYNHMNTIPFNRNGSLFSTSNTPKMIISDILQHKQKVVLLKYGRMIIIVN